MAITPKSSCPWVITLLHSVFDQPDSEWVAAQYDWIIEHPPTSCARSPTNGLRDKVLDVDTLFSLGFMKPFPRFKFGSSDKAFGTPGAGGSFGMADPDTGIGFGYVMTRSGFRLWSDPRELALRQALFHDVVAARPQT